MGKVDDWIALLMPRRCVLCRAPSGAGTICAACRDDLPWLAPGCPACGAALAPNVPAGPCARCAGGRSPRLRVRAPLAYAYPVDRMVTGTKFRGQPHFARALGELLAGHLVQACSPAGEAPVDRAARDGSALLPPNVVVPVPLHPRRLAQRGYNQALEIALPVAETLRLPLATRWCVRQRDTREQTGLSAAARRRNLRGAFAVRGDCRGARIAIVDDVLTTGSTAAALARALLAAGAADVELWAVARAVKG